MVATGGDDGRLVVRDARTAGAPAATWQFDASVCGLAFFGGPNFSGGDHLVVGLGDGRLASIQMGRQSPQMVVRCAATGASVRALAVRPGANDASAFAAGADDGGLRVATLSSSNAEAAAHTDYCRGLAWLGPNALATGGWDGVVRAWTVED